MPAARPDYEVLVTSWTDDRGNRATVTTTLFGLAGVLAVTSKACWSAGGMSIRLPNK